MKSKLLLLFCLILLCGCMSPSQGRISLIHWDSRSADQLEAAKYTDSAVFYEVSDPYRGARVVSGWKMILSFITQMKLKLSLCSIEWNSFPKSKVGILRTSSTNDFDILYSIDTTNILYQTSNTNGVGVAN